MVKRSLLSVMVNIGNAVRDIESAYKVSEALAVSLDDESKGIGSDSVTDEKRGAGIDTVKRAVSMCIMEIASEVRSMPYEVAGVLGDGELLGRVIALGDRLEEEYYCVTSLELADVAMGIVEKYFVKVNNYVEEAMAERVKE